MTVFNAITQLGAQVRDALTGHNPLPEMPLEIELLVAAWDNVKKNYLSAVDSYSADAHEIGIENVCAQIDEMMMTLVGQFQRATHSPQTSTQD